MKRELSLQLQPRQELTLKQNQLLMMLPQMQQAIYLLQLPVMELSAVINEELEKNPILEQESEEIPTPLEQSEKEEIVNENVAAETEVFFDQKDFEILKHLDEEYRDHFALSGNYQTYRTEEEEKLKNFVENNTCEKESLFTYLMKQAKETFDHPKDLELAECLIGNFDENGFLITPLEEIASLYNTTKDKLRTILGIIQTFDPCGIGAQDIRQSLLIQLQKLRKEKSLAYKIIDQHYNDLLHNRIPQIHKNSGHSYSEIKQAIEHIAKLDLRPGANFSRNMPQILVPDANIRQENDQLIVEINEDWTPSLRLNKRYMRMLKDQHLTREAREFIHHHLISAKWLVRNIYQRNETITRIVEFLADKQKEFFTQPNGSLIPMTMKELAKELNLHESTIARAVANKYISCSRGILPLRSFFSVTYVNIAGDDISAHTVRNAIKELIERENKETPLSDETISSKLKEIGIICARRTVSKHRNQLNLGTAQQRRKY